LSEYLDLIPISHCLG